MRLETVEVNKQVGAWNQSIKRYWTEGRLKIPPGLTGAGPEAIPKRPLLWSSESEHMGLPVKTKWQKSDLISSFIGSMGTVTLSETHDVSGKIGRLGIGLKER